MAVRICFRVPRQLQFRQDSSNHVFVSENAAVALALAPMSVSTAETSLPVAWRLYLPEVGAQDKKRRKATGVPQEIRFQTKPEIALQQIRMAVEREIVAAPVLADAAYGNDTKFREGINRVTI